MSVLTDRVVVVGGGPGGAFFARLYRLANPSTEVVLTETLPPLETFGFGVGLSISTQQNLGRSDPETFRRILKAAHRGHGARLLAHAGSTRMTGNDQMAIARAELLQILYEQAAAAGVLIQTGQPVTAFDVDANIVVAADGVGSLTRQQRSKEFGANVRVGRQHYIWCGVDRALPDALFAPVDTEFGTFVAHAYPYAEDRSTFLVETDEDTWRAAGFASTSDHLRPGETDEVARAFLEDVFAEHLSGHLLGNNSRWTQFRTVSCDRWGNANVVLLGDAAHTAHYSVGSGTKLAMEDAIALVGALAESDTVSQAVSGYEKKRKPAVIRLQRLAERSQLWWEGYVRRLDMTPERLLVSFLTRAGNVTVKDFRDREPALAVEALTQYAGESPPDSDVDTWVINRPIELGAFTAPSRDASQPGVCLHPLWCSMSDPWTSEADKFVAQAPDLAAQAGRDGIELVGPSDRAALLQRLDVAERLVRETTLLVGVHGLPALLPDLAAGLVAGRTHLVSFDDRAPRSSNAASEPGADHARADVKGST